MQNKEENVFLPEPVFKEDFLGGGGIADFYERKVTSHEAYA